MKVLSFYLSSFAIIASLLLSSHLKAGDIEDLQKAITDGKTSLTLRYRFEHVDQNGFEKKANASTLKTRLSFKSLEFKGFYSVLEVDNVTSIGNENYNSTVNGQTQYPVVADPTDTEMNQAMLGYKTKTTNISFGKQRINHNDQRFIGGVGWRQNEQTYDGLRVQYQPVESIRFDYSYIDNVNRIFGPTSNNSDITGDLHLLNVNYSIDKNHKFAGFVYSLDFETAIAIASQTIGLKYDGQVSNFNLHASFATQSDTGENPTRYSTQYLRFELNTKISSVTVAAGFESLGSDNGIGFSTPLATLHKFQGFADKFLATPGQGINDTYLKASTKLDRWSLTAVWHQLESDVAALEYGSELNLIVNYPVAKNTTLLIKYARYNADDFSIDTDKLWAMISLKI